jgi:membrane peptidoglycan carboxypeptidase
MAGHGSLGDGAPTSPLPVGPYLGDTPQYPGPGWREPPGASGAHRSRGRDRPRRRHRWLARTVAVLLGLALIGALALTGLLLVTPSVGDAQARTQQLDRLHHAVYPGPPVPGRFAASLVSTEDHRFYSEPGIDVFAIARLIAGRLSGRPDQGGATLYQQLAKMLYTPGRSGIVVQAEQVGLGIKLDLAYPKPEILQMYADVAYFGNSYYGLAAASCGYFGVTPARLSWPQAAMLAGLVQAPTADDPITHFAAARARQQHVLGRLAATGMLSPAAAASAYRQQLDLVGGRPGGCAAPSAP